MKGRRYYEPWQEELIIELYVNQQRGLAYISKQANSSPETIKKFLRNKGIHIRNQSEAAIISNKNRAKHKNKEYFQHQSSNMAWLLGFIASDGGISKTKNEVRFNLSPTDRDVLELIRQELELETEIKEHEDNKGYKNCTLAWTCEQHKIDLAEYSIVPAKTFTLKPPYKLDKKYWIDYIRGFFDGDGSINYLVNNKALRWQICGATTDMLEWVVDTLYEQFNIPKVNIQTQNRDGKILYVIQYSTNATKQIYNILYTPNSLYLPRKKKKFDEVIKMI